MKAKYVFENITFTRDPDVDIKRKIGIGGPGPGTILMVMKRLLVTDKGYGY